MKGNTSVVQFSESSSSSSRHPRSLSLNCHVVSLTPSSLRCSTFQEYHISPLTNEISRRVSSPRVEDPIPKSRASSDSGPRFYQTKQRSGRASVKQHTHTLNLNSLYLERERFNRKISHARIHPRRVTPSPSVQKSNN